MDIDHEHDEGRDDAACRAAGRQVLADPDLWALVLILLVALSLLS